MTSHFGTRHQSPSSSPGRTGATLTLLTALLILLSSNFNFTFVYAQSAPPLRPSDAHASTASVAHGSPDLRDGYAGDSACGQCHQAQAGPYRGSAHKLASSAPDVTSIRGHFTSTENVLATSNKYLYFLMQSKPQGFFETASVDLPLVGPISRTERIDIVVGSGRKGQTYLSWTKDRLFELPVSYWTEGDRWINSPGYVDGLPNFDKDIVPRCLECHATSIESLAPPSNRFNKEGVELGISCERCHGPGKAHVVLESSGLSLGPKADKAIYNPASAPRDRQMSLCSLCHAGPGNPLSPSFTFKPGDDIHRYIALAEMPVNQALDVHGSQVQLLKSSRCFKGSQMTCTTCHDVHRQQRDAASFSKTCLTCHKAESCGEYRAVGERIAQDCVSCHMPLQLTDQIVFNDNGAPVKPRIRNHRIAIYAQTGVR